MLSPALSYFDESAETLLALLEACDDGFLRKVWEVLVLDHKIVKVVTQVISASRTSVTVKNAEETDLGPFNIQICFTLWLENIQNNRDSVFIVLTDYALVCVSSITLDVAALLLRRLGRLVVLEEDRLRVQHRRVLAEE